MVLRSSISAAAVLTILALACGGASAQGADPAGGSPDDFARFIDAEIRKWAAVVRGAGIQPE